MQKTKFICFIIFAQDLLEFVCSEQNHNEDYIEQDIQLRIVNGKEVDPPFKYPFQAFFSADGYKCSGSILDNKHVLTAAHCLYNKYGQQHTPSWTSVQVGVHRVHSNWKCRADPKIGQNIQVEKFLLMSDYDVEENRNDIAILELQTEIQFNNEVGPISLPDMDSFSFSMGFQPDNVTVTGWGGLHSIDPNSTENVIQETSCSLQEADLAVVDNDACDLMTNNDNITKICAYAKHKDSCQGDSGGPLFLRLHELFVQVGIVSYGYGCATQLPGVYTRVSHYISWIKENMNQKESTTSSSSTIFTQTCLGYFGNYLSFLFFYYFVVSH